MCSLQMNNTVDQNYEMRKNDDFLEKQPNLDNFDFKSKPENCKTLGGQIGLTLFKKSSASMCMGARCTEYNFHFNIRTSISKTFREKLRLVSPWYSLS